MPDKAEYRCRCQFIFTSSLFQTYSAVSDYMSKRKTWIHGCSVIAALFIFLEALQIIFSVSAISSLLLTVICLPLVLIYLASIRTSTPPLWQLEKKKKWIIGLYRKEWGIEADEVDFPAVFELKQGIITFSVKERMIEAAIEDIRWVKVLDDLVLVGCLDDSKAIDAEWLITEASYHAIPAAAFLKSKLEGMNPDELVALLQECAKKHKRPKSRKAAWK